MNRIINIGFIVLAMLSMAALPVVQIAQAQSAQSTFTETLTTFGVDTIPPSVPTDLLASPISDSQIDLAWTPSADNFAVAGYRVFQDGAFLATTTDNEYQDTDLIASTLYIYTVEAFDASMNISSSSLPEATTTLATPVQQSPVPNPSTSNGLSSSVPSFSNVLAIYGVAFTPGLDATQVDFQTTKDANVRLYWGTTADYEIGSLSGLLYGTSHSFELTGLQPATSYFLKIVATDAAGFTVQAQTAFSTLLPAAPQPIPNPSGFTATAAPGKAALGWTAPNDPRITGFRIVRSDTFFPRDPYDGIPVYEGSGSSFTDTSVVSGTTYYYGIFSEAPGDMFSSGAIVSAYVPFAGEAVISPTSTDPFANFPQALTVDPMIARLTLDDFGFLQDDALLPHHGDTIYIDGTRNTTVSLAYDKVPEVLKTIAITLTDPFDPNKVFTFLLRANADKTDYEATVGPLGESRDYSMRINILDYQDQGLKRIPGDLLTELTSAVAAPAAPDLTGLFLLFLLALLLVIIALFWKRHDRSRAGDSAVPSEPHPLPVAHQ